MSNQEMMPLRACQAQRRLLKVFCANAIPRNGLQSEKSFKMGRLWGADGEEKTRFARSLMMGLGFRGILGFED